MDVSIAFVAKQLEYMLLMEEVRGSMEKLSEKGGLLKAVAGKASEKMVVQLSKSLLALHSADATTLGEDEVMLWKSWVETLHPEEYVHKFESMKATVQQIVVQGLASATLRMEAAVKVGSEKSWKAGLPADTTWEKLVVAATPLLDAAKATTITEAVSALMEDCGVSFLRRETS